MDIYTYPLLIDTITPCFKKLWILVIVNMMSSLCLSMLKLNSRNKWF